VTRIALQFLEVAADWHELMIWWYDMVNDLKTVENWQASWYHGALLLLLRTVGPVVTAACRHSTTTVGHTMPSPHQLVHFFHLAEDRRLSCVVVEAVGWLRSGTSKTSLIGISSQSASDSPTNRSHTFAGFSATISTTSSKWSGRHLANSSSNCTWNKRLTFIFWTFFFRKKTLDD